MVFPKKVSIKLLHHVLRRLNSLGLFPVIGAEIEFYLNPIINISQVSWKELGLNLEKEKGDNQFEVITQPNRDIIASAQEIIDLRDSIGKWAEDLGTTANFQAKPFSSQPGSALHIHLHLENKQGNNLYIKQENIESKLLLYSIGGLCDLMNVTMLLFAPYKEAYFRYIGNSIDSPSKVCWGGNNRSVAIRIPIDQGFNRRLEHRVACADSCPFEVILAILLGVLNGVEKKIMPREKIFGNAFLSQYDAPLITRSYKEAKEIFYSQKNPLLKMIENF
jgi:glutamine synthetase